MTEMTFAQAVRAALREEMLADERVFILGEDIGVYGGTFGVTDGMLAEFGEERIRDTPISEAAIAGAAIGAALGGMRPIAEFQFFDFVLLAMDQLHQPGGQDPLHVWRNGVGAHGGARPGRFRHRRRGAALAEPRGAVHPHPRAQGQWRPRLRPTPRAC